MSVQNFVSLFSTLPPALFPAITILRFGQSSETASPLLSQLDGLWFFLISPVYFPAIHHGFASLGFPSFIPCTFVGLIKTTLACNHIFFFFLYLNECIFYFLLVCSLCRVIWLFVVTPPQGGNNGNTEHRCSKQLSCKQRYYGLILPHFFSSDLCFSICIYSFYKLPLLLLALNL